MEILEWLGGDDTGESSKTLALTALGRMPKHPAHPHDGDDFGRCYRLLRDCPDAAVGLERLERDGGAMWAALVPRWKDIEAAYLHDVAKHARGDKGRDGYKCYELMRSILKPAEADFYKNSKTHFRVEL